MVCKVSYKASVEKDLRRIDKQTVTRLLRKLEAELSKDPSKGERIKGEFEGLFNYRIGDYSVIYTRTADGVLVLRISHRKDVYREK